ncbi:helix-turn-helix domain-containing protein [Desertivirga arenae]|uniref:helix-turn-helix domain-containing protein n=1 Tax=Desertivirga arenae TaxID=2810309 RepID=UPI001A9586A9|nr:helix-turn-helix transcriptional regulator [Pedobacter sp. SYSU D00823]
MEKEIFLKQLGERIRVIREETGLTQAELAYKVGKDQQSLQRLEKGGVNPSIFYLWEIAMGLGVGLEYLTKNVGSGEAS